MKAVTLNTLGLQFPRYRKHTGNIRQIDVECRIEKHAICRQRRKVLSRKTDHREGGWRMQRRKSRRGVQLMQYLFVDQAMLTQLRSAMHDTVTDRDGGRGAAVVEEFSDAGNSIPLVGDGYCLGQSRIVAQILRVKLAALPADGLCLASQHQFGFRGRHGKGRT